MSYGYFFFKIKRSNKSSRYEVSCQNRADPLCFFMMTSCLTYLIGGFFQAYFESCRLVLRLQTSRFHEVSSKLTLRPVMWKTIGKFYGIQFEEIQMQSLKDFHSFNEFFTRKLKPGLRPIENAHDPRVITSPCDGKVLNFGEITESKDGPCKYQLECIKGHTYPLDEFLFGVTSSNRDSNLTTNIVESAK